MSTAVVGAPAVSANHRREDRLKQLHSEMENSALLAQFMNRVWSSGDADAVDEFLADSYVIYSDPGDPWDGKTLSRVEFKERLRQSRAPFPDLSFEITDTVAEGEKVAIAWIMCGTNVAPLGGRPPTGRGIAVAGMTVYYFSHGRIAGHRQVVDRMTVARQLGLMG
jgi:steroid delta-isomerase-like uncharacterized protein